MKARLLEYGGEAMHIFLKKARREPVFILLAAILVLASAFSCLGFGAWESAMRQVRSIEGSYTTIAVPVGAPSDPAAGAMEYVMDENGNTVGQIRPQYNEDGSVSYFDPGTGELLRTVYPSDVIMDAARSAPQVISSSSGAAMRAELSGAEPLASGSVDRLSYNLGFDEWNHNFCVLAVRCVKVLDIGMEGGASGNRIGNGQKDYSAELELLDCLAISESYSPEALSGCTLTVFPLYGQSLYREDGSFVLEEGKTYVVRGFFSDLRVESRLEYVEGEDGELVSSEVRSVDSDGLPRYFYFSPKMLDGVSGAQETADEGNPILAGAEGLRLLQMTEQHEGYYDSYYCAAEGQPPFCAGYEGDVSAFLSSDEGRVWREEIIPWAETNINSAAVVLTDNLYALYNFNSGTASILEGRAFEDVEYEQGAAVCLVSAEFAAYNGLAPGDRLGLDFYDTGSAQSEYSMFSTGGTVTELTSRTLVMTPENRIGFEQEYEIVGIYTAPEWTPGQQSFTAETIFVPKASVPDAERYESDYAAFLNALELENGASEAFLEYMAARGMPDSFICFDQQYSALETSIEALTQNSTRLLVLSSAVFVLVLALYMALAMHRMGGTARAMRLLGQSDRAVFREMQFFLIPAALISVILGAAAAALAFGDLTRAILSENIRLSFAMLLICALAQFVILALCGLACSRRVSKRPLMTEKR